MGKRYHCEYCNRSFADTPQSRRNHINGVQHKRNRKLHYDSFKDPAVLLAEEANKPPCRRFFTTGSCGFGANCKYSHTNPQLLLAAQSEQASNQTKSCEPDPSLEEWLDKWKKKQKKKESKKKSPESTGLQSSFTLPAGLPPLQDLPLSLIPPPPGGYPELPRVDWG